MPPSLQCCSSDMLYLTHLMTQLVVATKRSLIEMLILWLLPGQTSAVQAAALRKLDIRADVQPQTSWNVELFASEVNTRNPEINWESVARGLDHPGFVLPDQASFKNLMNIWRQCTPEAFPLHAVIGKDLWHNTKGQAQFLLHATAEEDPSLFTFEHALRKQPPLEGLHIGMTKDLAFGVMTQFFSSLALPCTFGLNWVL
jgi:hypothetical protein